LLAVLVAVAVPLFFFTRSMAARNRAMNVSVAREWRRKAQDKLLAGDASGGGIPQGGNCANPEYVLALATTPPVIRTKLSRLYCGFGCPRRKAVRSI
jgi:hypothetical protein